MTLDVENLQVTWPNGTPALLDVSFSLPAGALGVITGRAGAGKSTLCQALNGLIPSFTRADVRGRVRIGGVDMTDWPVSRRAERVGFVAQDYESQIFSTRVDLEVAFFPENLGVARDALVERVRRALAAVGLDGFEARDPLRLSGGQKQRLVIAAVLAGAPHLVVLDEPLSDLDPQGRRDVLGALLALRATGTTVLLAENDDEALIEADRVGVLCDGVLTAWGTPTEVLTDNDRLRAAGLRPQPLCGLFERLGLPARPLRVEEACRVWPACATPTAAPQALDAPAAEATSSAADACALEAIDVRFAYPGGTEVLHGVSLAVPCGEMVALLGLNGSGKSTLAQHFNGLLRADRGEVRIHGQPIEALTAQDLAREVGFVFQSPDAQIFAETVLEEVSFAPRLLGLSEGEARARVEEALSAVGLTGRERDDPFSMTRGERQRVAVASVLTARPRVLVFDEPTTGLDPAQIDDLMALLTRLCEEGRTLLVITHALDLAARHCHRTVVMRDGRVTASGLTGAILHGDALAQAGLVAPPVARFARALGLPHTHAQAWPQDARRA